MHNFSHEKLARELLVAVRGKLSQVQLNRKMKFRSNQIHRWETGTAKISWKEFCTLALASGVPLESACEEFLCFSYTPANAPKLIAHLAGPANQTEVAKIAGVSRSMVSRWLAGKIDPSLEQILLLIDASTWPFPSFVGALAGEKKLPSMEAELIAQQKERELHYRYPWVGPLLLTFLSPEYRKLPAHREGFAARAIGISLEQERTALAELKLVGAVEMVEKKYRPRIRRINVAGNRAGNRRIREYWMGRCMAWLKSDAPAPARPGQWPYMVFSMHPDNFEKIRGKIMQLYQEIETYSQAKEEDDQIYLFSAQLFDIKQLP